MPDWMQPPRAVVDSRLVIVQKPDNLRFPLPKIRKRPTLMLENCYRIYNSVTGWVGKESEYMSLSGLRCTPHQTSCSRAICWMLIAIFTFCFQQAFAGFSLQRSQSKNSGDGNEAFHAVLVFTSRVSSPNDEIRHEVKYLPDPNDEDGEIPLSMTGSIPDLGRQACLLATPGRGAFNSKEWWVEAEVLDFEDNTPAKGAYGGSTVFISPFQMGMIRGVRIEVDPSRARDIGGKNRRASRIRIEVNGPRQNTKINPVMPLSDMPEAERFVRALCVNGNEIDTLDFELSESKSTAQKTLQSPAGDYRVTYGDGDELMALDMTQIGSSGTEFAQLGINHHGALLPPGGIDGDTVWFYAPYRVTAYDQNDSVFVDTDGPTTPTMQSREAFLTLSSEGTEVEQLHRSRTFDWNQYYHQITTISNQTHFFFHRAGAPSSGSYSSSYTYQLPFYDYLTTDTIHLKTRLIANNSTVSFDPDHYTDLTLGGVAAPQHTWEGQVVEDTFVALTGYPNPLPGTTIEFKHTIPTTSPVVQGGFSDQQLLDLITLEWEGYPRAENGERLRLELPESSDPEPRRVTIGGFAPGTVSTDVALLNITDPENPIRLLNAPTFTDVSGTVALEFEVAPDAEVYYVQRFDSITTPNEIVWAETLPEIPALPYQLQAIYVRPPEFAASLAPLIALRGPGVYELEPQAAYNAYNGGQQSPYAIQSALRDLLTTSSPWRAPFPDVLLVGFASLDIRDYLGLQAAPQVPCFIEQSVQTDPGYLENGHDYYYTNLLGEDNLPDVKLGRIPAQTTENIDWAVARIINHDALAPTLRNETRTGVFVAGRDRLPEDPMQFIDDQDQWIGYWSASGNPNVRIDKDESTNGTPEFEAMQAALQDGPGGAAYLQYMGHGFTNQWENSRMMKSNKVPELDTENRWPLVATFTCFNGMYNYPGSTIPSLAEAWLFGSETGGAVANIAPCGVDYYFEQSLFTRGVMQGFAEPDGTRPRSAGELFLQAQTWFALNVPGLEKTLHEYILFGDPATDLAIDAPIATEASDWEIWQ